MNLQDISLLPLKFRFQKLGGLGGLPQYWVTSLDTYCYKIPVSIATSRTKALHIVNLIIILLVNLEENNVAIEWFKFKMDNVTYAVTVDRYNDENVVTANRETPIHH